MPDDVSRLVGIEGLVVTGVLERTEQLELRSSSRLMLGVAGGAGARR